MLSQTKCNNAKLKYLMIHIIARSSITNAKLTTLRHAHIGCCCGGVVLVCEPS